MSGGSRGLWEASREYNTKVLSVLSFVGQFLAPSEDILSEEAKALRKLFAGPGNWISREDIFRLDDKWNPPFKVASVDIVSKAARLRVSEHERSDSIDFPTMRALQQEMLTLGPHKTPAWFSWLDYTIVTNICNAITDCKAQGVTASLVLSTIGKDKDKKVQAGISAYGGQTLAAAGPLLC